MSDDPYVMKLGKILGNLHSLEALLRVFLANLDERDALAPGQTFDNLKVGDSVAESPFTNWDTLGALIRKYNAIVQDSHRVDGSLVDLRDALAHGRFWSGSNSFPLQLLRFSRPEKGRTTVTWSQTIDDEWLDLQIRRVFEAVTKVAESSKSPPAW